MERTHRRSNVAISIFGALFFPAAGACLGAIVFIRPSEMAAGQAKRALSVDARA